MWRVGDPMASLGRVWMAEMAWRKKGEGAFAVGGEKVWEGVWAA